MNEIRKTILLFFLTFFLGLPVPSKAQQKPNVLFLIVDDMNDYGFYKTIQGTVMPFLDRFKTTAVVFEYAYCGSPVCTPSRAAVFSELFPHSNGAHFNKCNPFEINNLISDTSFKKIKENLADYILEILQIKYPDKEISLINPHGV